MLHTMYQVERFDRLRHVGCLVGVGQFQGGAHVRRQANDARLLTMEISKFFNVLVVTGASATVGLSALTGCGSSDDSSGGSSGATASGGSAGATTGSGGASAGTTGASAGSSGAAACNLQPSACNAQYLDDENANGCCCWISAASGPGICPEGGCAPTDTCCVGHVIVQ